MIRHLTRSGFLGLTLLSVFATVAPAQVDPINDPFAVRPGLPAPNYEKVRDQALSWLADQDVDAAIAEAATELWRDTGSLPSGSELIDRLAQTFALGDPRASDLVEQCSKPREQLVLSPQDWLRDEQTPPLERNNLRLLLGRWLTHERMFDEAAEELADLKPEDVVDPASLLFFQGVVHHRLLNASQGLDSLDRLMTDVEEVPQRYRSVAELMVADLQGLEDDSLDHITRRMEDIRRRLDLGRAGKKVRGIEDGVIASLDKMIEELEKQQQDQQSSGSNGSNQSSQPAPDSRIMGGNGPGDVDRRDIGAEDGWGNLPAKQREEAMQAIGKEFPSHYRDVIEQYFRRLASEESSPE
jgi:hypothetical protein